MFYHWANELNHADMLCDTPGWKSRESGGMAENEVSMDNLLALS